MKRKRKQFQFRDDPMFCAVLAGDKQLTKEFAETLLGKEIGKVTYLNAQQVLNYSTDAKHVRLDIYLKCTRAGVVNIEMENDRIKRNNFELCRRSRYYGSLSDSQEYPEGTDYREIKETHIIFICTADPPARGFRAKRTGKVMCSDDREYDMRNGMEFTYLYCKAENRNVNSDLNHLLNYIAGNETPKTPLTKKIDKAVRKINSDREWRRWMTTLQDRLDEKYRLGMETGEKRGEKIGQKRGVKIGEKKGIRENQRTIVLSMLKQGVEEAEIRKLLITVPSSVITEVIGEWNSRKEYIH